MRDYCRCSGAKDARDRQARHALSRSPVEVVACTSAIHFREACIITYCTLLFIQSRQFVFTCTCIHVCIHTCLYSIVSLCSLTFFTGQHPDFASSLHISHRLPHTIDTRNTLPTRRDAQFSAYAYRRTRTDLRYIGAFQITLPVPYK
jgi:hypothetical protein